MKRGLKSNLCTTIKMRIQTIPTRRMRGDILQGDDSDFEMTRVEIRRSLEDQLPEAFQPLGFSTPIFIGKFLQLADYEPSTQPSPQEDTIVRISLTDEEERLNLVRTSVINSLCYTTGIFRTYTFHS